MITKKSQSSEELEYIPLDPDQVWSSYDLGGSAALICAGFELLSIDRGQDERRSLFVFRKEDGIENVADLYWSDRLEIKARTYFDTLKMLKNRLYSE